jgi:hypothetical protein
MCVNILFCSVINIVVYFMIISMKKPIFFLLLSALLHAEQAEEPMIEAPSLPPQPEWHMEEKPKTHFSYFSVGTCGPLIPYLPEVSIGWRKLDSRHVWDVQGGGSLLLGSYAWGQASYLYYFLPNTGTYSTPYCGLGLTVGYSRSGGVDFRKHPYYGNIPFTMGCQWGKEGKNQFFQVQFTPLFITTLSYGVGY